MERAGKHGDHTTQHDEGTAFRPGDYFSGLLVALPPRQLRVRRRLPETLGPIDQDGAFSLRFLADASWPQKKRTKSHPATEDPTCPTGNCSKFKEPPG